MSESKTPQPPQIPTVLRRSAAYQAARNKVRGKRLEHLAGTEDDIAEDPTHNHWRRPVAGGSTIDYSAGPVGLLVVYRIHPDFVELEQLIDFPASPRYARRG